MTGPRIGSLFSGYGGLDLGVQAELGGDVAWHVEFDAAPSKILAHHWPDVPNYGDVTAVDWSTVEPVDILTGGFPCQDVSLAGGRAGLKAGTRSGLWSEFARAIDVLRPQLVVIENVRGLLSAEATGVVESDAWGLGNGPSGPTLRALGAVLGDLADLGYDAEWCGVRAADAGAPHRRFRVFIVAYPSAPDCRRGAQRVGSGLRETDAARLGRRRPDDDSLPHLAADSDGWKCNGRERVQVGAPVERVASPWSGDGTSSDTERFERERRRDLRDLESASGEGAGEGHQRERDGDAPGDRRATDWGAYEPAIRRWELATYRVAPAPTEGTARNGAQRLAPRFVEWMMGLPDGWVTGVKGLTRAQQLKALGNGVVPQQAALAIRILLKSAWAVAA